MSIYVSIVQGQPPKDRGDLLESLTQRLLETKDFEVDTEIRKTGMELDLLCRSKVNQSRKIYVECKARIDNVQSDVIKQLVGTQDIENYSEAWLVTTSELGKDAKGLVENIQQGKKAEVFSFYTPKKLISAFVSAGIITSEESARLKVYEITKNKKSLGITHLLISPFGIFWATEHFTSGKINGVVFTHAEDGEIVVDEELLTNISSLDFDLRKLDFGTIFKLLDKDDKTIETRRLKGAGLNKKYYEIITDLKLPTSPARAEDARLDNIFVYPDIEALDVKTDPKQPKLISSKTLTRKGDTIDSWLIFGADVSGKTALAYMVQKKLVDSELSIAIYIDALKIKNTTPKALSKLISFNYAQQYDVSGIPQKTIDNYLEEQSDNITLLIDDFERLNSKGNSGRISLIETLKVRFRNIIVFSNISQELELTTRQDAQKAFEGFKVYRILQLGHVKRDELVEKWLKSQNSKMNDGELLAKKDEVAKKINSAVGANYIPTYPFYSLTMLQLLENSSEAKIQNSTYAELYGFFITFALLSNQVKREDIDFYITYLSHLAYTLHKINSTHISTVELEKSFAEYQVFMDLDKSFRSVHDKLVTAKILRFDSDNYSFNFEYYRYYFFAKYLSDSIEDDSTKKIIEVLVDNLHQEDSANTVIFLVHHSRNSAIIDAILAKAKKQFNEIELQTLSASEIANINKLISEDIQIILNDESPTRYRKTQLKRQDEFDRKKDTKKDDVSIVDVYGQITLAFRTIDVLGKITSNHYGSLNADKKAVIMKELYELGFRSLRAFLESFQSYTGALQSHLESEIDDKNLSSKTMKQKAANEIIYAFTHIITYSFLRRVSNSVVSPNLLKTVERVLKQEDGPATELTLISTRLNFANALSKYKQEISKLYDDLSGNTLARDLLRFIVLQHLYKFEVNYKDKQAICAALKIDIKKINQKQLDRRMKK